MAQGLAEPRDVVTPCLLAGQAPFVLAEGEVEVDAAAVAEVFPVKFGCVATSLIHMLG
jgi:hypothetical protein